MPNSKRKRCRVLLNFSPCFAATDKTKALAIGYGTRFPTFSTQRRSLTRPLIKSQTRNSPLNIRKTSFFPPSSCLNTDQPQKSKGPYMHRLLLGSFHSLKHYETGCIPVQCCCIIIHGKTGRPYNKHYSSFWNHLLVIQKEHKRKDEYKNLKLNRSKFMYHHTQ